MGGLRSLELAEIGEIGKVGSLAFGKVGEVRSLVRWLFAGFFCGWCGLSVNSVSAKPICLDLSVELG